MTGPTPEQTERDRQFANLVADLFEREAEHWEAEYADLTNRYGSYSATKSRAAWLLGARMLRRRVEQYRSGSVGFARIGEEE